MLMPVKVNEASNDILDQSCLPCSRAGWWLAGGSPCGCDRTCVLLDGDAYGQFLNCTHRSSHITRWPLYSFALMPAADTLHSGGMQTALELPPVSD